MGKIEFIKNVGEYRKGDIVNASASDIAEIISLGDAIEIKDNKKDIIEKEKDSEEWTELFKKPDILNIIIDEFEKKIVGEKITKKVIFLCLCGLFVTNAQKTSFNIILNSKSGSGKDHVSSNIIKIFPKEKTLHFTRISPMALTYFKGSSDIKEDLENWTWDNKILYLEDVSQKVIDSEVIKVLLSSGATKSLIFNGKKNKSELIDVKGKPIMIVSFANNIMANELIRRIETCPMNESKEHSRAIIMKQAEIMATGKSEQYNPLVTVGLNNLKPIKVIIPFSDKIAHRFPIEDTIIRTKFNRFCDYMKSSCALHQLQREKNDLNEYLATKEDYENAREVFMYLNSNKKLIPLTTHQKKILDYFEKINNSTVKLSPIKIHNDLNQWITPKAVTENLQTLVSYGYLEPSTDLDSMNREKTHYSFNPNNFNELENFTLPPFEQL